MRGLADIKLLVLVGASESALSEADLDLLDRRTTAHRLPLRTRTFPMTLLRLLRRLALGQDNVILMYDPPPATLLPIAVVARFAGCPVLYVSTKHSKLAPLLGRLGVIRVKLGGLAGDRHEEAMLRAIAKISGRSWPEAGKKPLRIDLGCGSQVRPGFVGIDARRTRATAIVSDARAIAIADHVADEVYASCLLEHFENPHDVLREIHRVLVPDGQAVLRLPNLGTYSSHLDLTHRFLADLALWRRILSGYFEEVEVLPVGTKYRDDISLVRANWVLVNLLKWYELAQGWDFVCRRPKATPSVEYIAWWEE